MGEFFKGWRRKAGLVTLAIACVLAVGWMRSDSNFERVSFNTGESQFHWFIVSRQEFTWARVAPVIDLDQFAPPTSSSFLGVEMNSFNARHFLAPTFVGGADKYKCWRREFCGIIVGEGLYNFAQSPRFFGGFWTVPCWIPVLLLTLLSAYLILWKSRKAKGGG